MARLILCSVILALMSLILLPAMAGAQAAQCDFRGLVSLGGQDVEDGTKITAAVGGKTVATTATYGSQYAIRVTGDFPGRSVHFFIETPEGSLWAGASSWEIDGDIRKDISACIDCGVPEVTLQPAQGKTTRVCGSGFPADSYVTITWEAEKMLTVPTGDAGAFCTSVIPPTSVSGDYAILVTDRQGPSAVASFHLYGTDLGGGTIDRLITTDLPPGTAVSADYDPATGRLELGIPQGDAGPVGANGKSGRDGIAVMDIVSIILAVVAMILVLIFLLRPRQEFA